MYFYRKRKCVIIVDIVFNINKRYNVFVCNSLGSIDLYKKYNFISKCWRYIFSIQNKWLMIVFILYIDLIY